jgi:hypothetical protein
MPYITQVAREFLASGGYIETSGELNYSFTQIIQQYVKDHGKSYARFNDVIGALEGAKAEFYRRVVAPYEDEKIKQNGDVY